MRLGIFAAAVAGVLALGAEHCQAQGWGLSGPFLYGAGYGLFVYERLPQYSLFPPVYYKHPVPRSYGYSPYAYPPGVITPPVSPVSRRIIFLNPYVAQTSAVDDKVVPAPQPLVIHNPFASSLAQASDPRPAPGEIPAPADLVAPGG